MNPHNTDAPVVRRPSGCNVHTGAEVADMLRVMGLQSIEDLLSDIPAAVRLGRPLDLPPPLSEWALRRDVREMAVRNETTLSHACYLGTGSYEHHVPAVVDAIVSRGEFLTAYTPYQPEMSQGLLQALFEFQVLVGRLLGRESVNCSVYDGATALAEASWMMCSASGLRRILVPQALFADYRAVLDTYLGPRGVEIETFSQDARTGISCTDSIRERLARGGVAGVVLQTPNAFGVIEDVGAIAAICREHGTTLCVSTNPLLCGWIEPPGQLGADIVACEAQSLGLPLQAGGPYVGVIACAKPLERYLPGRLVGRVHDLNGKLGYALVKEDREQHVARDRATSHICSNQALNAIRVAIHLACLGERNFLQLAEANAAGARHLQTLVTQLPGVRPLRSGVHFNEFSIELPLDAGMFCDRMRDRGIFAGVPVRSGLVGHDRGLLVAVTETKTPEDLSRYATEARLCLQGVSA